MKEETNLRMSTEMEEPEESKERPKRRRNDGVRTKPARRMGKGGRDT